MDDIPFLKSCVGITLVFSADSFKTQQLRANEFLRVKNRQQFVILSTDSINEISLINKSNILNETFIINFGVCSQERFLNRVNNVRNDTIIVTLSYDNFDQRKYRLFNNRFNLNTKPLKHLFGF